MIESSTECKVESGEGSLEDSLYYLFLAAMEPHSVIVIMIQWSVLYYNQALAFTLAVLSFLQVPAHTRTKVRAHFGTVPEDGRARERKDGRYSRSVGW